MMARASTALRRFDPKATLLAIASMDVDIIQIKPPIRAIVKDNFGWCPLVAMMMLSINHHQATSDIRSANPHPITEAQNHRRP